MPLRKVKKMISFNKDHKKYKLWTLGILFILLMSFPAIAQVNNSKLNKSVVNKPRIDKTKKTPGSTAIMPDPVKLRLTGLSVHTPNANRKITAGNSATLRGSVQNKGVMPSGRFGIEIYISKDREGDINSTRLFTLGYLPLAAKAVKTFSSPLTIPETQPPGNWYIVAKVLTKEGSVVDSRFDRRHLIVLKKIAAQPSQASLGVSILSFSPERPRRGEPVDITIQVRNGRRLSRPDERTGAPASNINVTWGFYRDCADGAHIHDFMAQRIPGTLEYGQSKTLTVRKTFPRDAPSRTIKIRATAKAAESRLVTSDCEDILVFSPNE